ncbi:MAG: TRAP transporter small permease subunit [Desulfobulbaceae bacterium]|nr:TRAP transporter small permease subunit [Desulfobulbaceae bacterium]
MLIKLESFFDLLIGYVSKITSLLLLLMIFNVFYDVVMRYFFHNSSVGMQEMEWHLFSMVILYGVGVALKDDGHVRVDFLYEKYSVKAKAMVNISGTLLFLLPLALLVAFGSIEFVFDAYSVGEISEDPGGLTHRWIIKSMIPAAMVFLIFSAIGFVIKNINLYRGAK